MEETWIRATKFPYFFWSFNKAYRCKLDFKDNVYTNLEKQTQYRFKKFNNYVFLLLKYLPIIFICLICFNKYDFVLNKPTIIAYVIAILLVIVVNLLEDIIRRVCVIGILIITFVLGTYNEYFFLAAYAIKYFLLLTIPLMLFLDIKLQPYALLNNSNKVVAHILVVKKEKK